MVGHGHLAGPDPAELIFGLMGQLRNRRELHGGGHPFQRMGVAEELINRGLPPASLFELKDQLVERLDVPL